MTLALFAAEHMLEATVESAVELLSATTGPAVFRVELREGPAAERHLLRCARASGSALLRRGDAALLVTKGAALSSWLSGGWTVLTGGRDLDAGHPGRRTQLLALAEGVSPLPIRVIGDSAKTADALVRRFARTHQHGDVHRHVFKGATVHGSMAVSTDGMGAAGTSESVAAEVGPSARLDHEKSGIAAAALISGRAESNHWHWMTEGLLSVILLIEHAPEGLLHLVGHQRSRQELEAFQLLGVSGVNYIEVKRWQKIAVQELAATSAIFGALSARPPRKLLEVFDRILRAACRDDSAAPPFRRLYVSRRDSPKRRLLNEEALEAALADLGFEVIAPGALSVAEQARLFAEAAVVVAPHGAGLTNLGFCRPGVKVLELHASHYLNPCMFRLGELAELDMYLYAGTSSASDALRHRRPYSVNISRVLECVEQLVELGEIRPRLWAGAAH